MARSKKSAPPIQQPRSVDAPLLASVVILVTATAIVHVVSARPPLSWMWGVHFYRFFPAWVLAVSSTLLAAITVVAVARRERTTAVVDRALAPLVPPRRFLAAAGISVVAGTALFWFARICHTY